MSRNTIAVCIVKMDEDVQTESIKAITKRAEERGLNVEIYNSFVELVNKDLYDKGEESIFELMDYRHLSGIIYFPEKIKNSRINENIVKYGKEHNLPVVAIDRKVPECISITYDYSRAFEEIVEHLISVHDCKTFYMMAGMQNNAFSDERIAAARRVIERYGLSLPDENIGYGDFWDVPCRKIITDYLESGRDLPDAFIAANDTMAMVICDELNKRGINVPEDVIVTGFDGIEAEKYAIPRLTTAETDLERSGFMAVDAILSYNSTHKVMMNHCVVPFHTRYSQSCGCVPKSFGSVNFMLQTLHNDLSEMYFFGNMMTAMLSRMSDKNTLVDMIKEAERFRTYLDEYDDMYLCIRRDIAEIDESISENMIIPEGMKKSADKASDRQMVLLWENRVYVKSKYPMVCFTMRELLPGRSEIMDEKRNMIFLPLHIRQKVFGYLAASVKPTKFNYKYYKLSYFSRNLSQALSDVIQTLKLKEVNEKLLGMNNKLEELYVTDYLTGINNRRGFFKSIDERLSGRRPGGLMLASVDLNGLKTINDKHGHHEGDRAICAIADILKSMKDENSICARFGGDEFAFCTFLDEYDEKASDKFRSELTRRVEEVDRSGNMGFYFSASSGAVTVRGEETGDMDRIFKLADEKMYEDKVAFHLAHKEFDRRKAGAK